METQEALSYIAIAREAAKDGPHEQALTNLFIDVYGGEEQPDMELASLLRGRFEGTPPWDAGLSVLVSAIVDEQAYAFKPEELPVEVPDNFSLRSAREAAGGILYGEVDFDTHPDGKLLLEARDKLVAYIEAYNSGAPQGLYFAVAETPADKRLAQAAGALWSAFYWGSSAEGHAYWYRVTKALSS